MHGPPVRARRIAQRVSFSVLFVVSLFIAAPTAAAQQPDQTWVGAWATSPLRPDPVGVTPQAILSREGFDNQTLRQIVYPHFGGNLIRVRLTNTYGNTPLLVGQANIAYQDDEAWTVQGSDRQLTFGGSTEVLIPAGAQAYSDPVTFALEPARTVAISLFLPTPTGPVTWHNTGRQTLYVADGNQAAVASGQEYGAWRDVPSWYLISGIEVAASPQHAAIVLFGDSITDGTASTLDANNRWPNYLARRLLSRPDNQLSVLNQGIGGNRVLTDTPTHQNALARLDRDVFSQNGVRYVVLLEGINDIGQTCQGNVSASADDIIAGYKQIITQVKVKGLKIFGATLTPFQGATPNNPAYFCDTGEAARQAVNTWIRTSGAFDGVIDFDLATRDPDNPAQFHPAYDSGDHLHPNDAGYEAMANAVDLAMFR